MRYTGNKTVKEEISDIKQARLLQRKDWWYTQKSLVLHANLRKVRTMLMTSPQSLLFALLEPGHMEVMAHCQASLSLPLNKLPGFLSVCLYRLLKYTGTWNLQCLTSRLKSVSMRGSVVAKYIKLIIVYVD